MKYLLIFITFYIFVPLTSGQYVIPESGYVFDDSTVPRIDVFMDSDSLEQLLAPENLQSDHLYPATVLFTREGKTDTLGLCGFRLRGNTSRSAYKKSFKISLNAFESGNSFNGISKLNLNGQHNDPSIMRSKLCFDMFNSVGVPSSRSNHIRLYINTQYRGLYLNTEHINKDFLEERFTDKSGNLWKCLYPADLHYLGNNPELYKEQSSGGQRAYDLKTNEAADDYSRLAKFLDILNNREGEDFKCQLEKIFDVENYLKAMVLDVLTANWDGPIVNKNNFYLYHNPDTDKITYIPYDLDNTLGIDWFNVDWPYTDIYNWSGISGQYRPIYDKIMAVPEYRDKATYYYEKFISEFFNVNDISVYLGEFQNLIAPYRVNDAFAEGDYGWTYEDFLASFDNALGHHVKYGITEYVNVRVNAAQFQLELSDAIPLITDIQINWSPENIEFLISAEDDFSQPQISMEYIIDNGPEMSADIVHTGGSQYTADFTVTEGQNLYYRFLISDDSGHSRYYPYCGYNELKLGYEDTPALVINEIMASNQNFITDDFGDFNDWIELYNVTGSVLPIGKFFLSDNPENPGKWQLPNTALNPNQYLIIWADEDGHQGDDHANFKLNKAGEFIGLFDEEANNFAPIDTFTFPPQETDETYGRLPNGTGGLQFLPYPTHGYSNEGPSGTEVINTYPFSVYPNPASGQLTISLDDVYHNAQYALMTSQGQKIDSGILDKKVNTIQLPHLMAGLYFLNITIDGQWQDSQQIFVIR